VLPFPSCVFDDACAPSKVNVPFGWSTSIDTSQYTISALLVLQIILIVALFVQNRRHSRARADVERGYADVTHAARLALIGEITASVAHEVTQPLSAILSNVETADLLLRQPQPDVAMVREILADVRQDDLRAHSIVRRLRTLLQKRELQLEEVDVNLLASSVLSLVLPDAVRRSVIIRTSLDPALPRAFADPVHLQQVLLNLLINAMNAMKDTPADRRVLEVRTEACAEHNLMVTVLDQGHGFEPAKKEKLFESFYTTREDGLGLGLSLARSIVTMHGGAIWAENRREGGAAFAFTVPSKTH
jgi:signal transduction histidine kinase